MKRETFFLKLVIFLIGAIVIALSIFALPAIASGAANYFPKWTVYLILISIYATTIPFFFALYQTLMLLKYIDNNNAFSKLSVKALKNIKNSAIVISLLYMVCLPFLYIMAEFDDAPGIIVIGLFFVSASSIIAIFATVLQKLLQKAIDLKEENELTI